MKRSWLLVVLAVTIVVRLPATTIISCTLDTVNSPCYSRGMFSFTDTLDWQTALAAVGIPGQDGTAFSTSDNPHYVGSGGSPWLARTTNGVDVQATLGAAFSGGNRLLTRMDNTFYVWNSTYWAWDTVGSYTSPETTGLKTFAGHFAGIDPNNPTGDPSHPYGAHLLGSVDGQGPIVLSFNQAMQQVGFDISSYFTPDFTATLIAYNGATVLHTYVINVVDGGGACLTPAASEGGGGLIPESPNDPGQAPVPCNDAAFIALDAGSQVITSISVVTSDGSGFLIDGLFFRGGPPPPPGVPEPLAGILTGAGLAALGLLAKKRAGRSR